MVIAERQANSRFRLNKEEVQALLRQMPPDQLMREVAKEDSFVWIFENVPTENGRKLTFDRRPYLVKILRDFSPHIVYKKSAQVGITMCGGIAKALYIVDTLGINSIYTFPTATDVSDFSKGRFRNIVHSSRYLSTRIGNVDNQGMVKIGDSFIYFKGTWSDRQGISVPSDLNVHDELDFSKPDIREIFSSRLDASMFDFRGDEQNGWEWDFSTPTIPGFGVSALYDMSDQHQWWVRCSRCNRSQRVNFFKNLRKTRKGKRYFGCLRCDKKLNRAKGKWIPKYPERNIRGYHITQPMCDYIDAHRMWETWERLKKSPAGKRKFYNFNLGLEYEDGTESITKSLILNRVVDGTTDFGPIFIGADQGDILHIEVVKVVEGRRHIIWIGTLNNFDEYVNLIDHYNPRVAVLDGLPNHENARRIARTKHNVYCIYYGGDKKLERKEWMKDLKEKKELTLPRTDLLDRAVTEWTSGNVVIESYIPTQFIEDFADQMSNMKRQFQEGRDGQQKAVWVNVGDDHYRHADAYTWVAQEIGTAGQSSLLDVSRGDPALAYAENLFTENEEW